MKDSKYFDEHVVMAVEIEYDSGGRNWRTMRGSEVKAYCDRIEESDYASISDVDYCTKQDDEWVRKVLNTADYNWRKNKKWVESLKVKSLWDLIDYIVEHKLVA